MRFRCGSILALGLVAPVFAYPSSNVENREPPGKYQIIRSTFRRSWFGYMSVYPHDTLHPVSGTFADDRNGWGVTIVDALSTAILTTDFDIVDEILQFIPTIDFNTTAVANQGVSVFETNIRYLGGLLSAYDLLTGPFNGATKNEAAVDALLQQAVSLADSLKIAFDTPSGIPDPTVFLNPKRRISGSDRNNIAEIGTLVLEWTRLSDLTGNPEYARLAQKAEAYLLEPLGSPEAFPGLVGTFVSTGDGSFLDSDGGWSGLTDSFYEYLIKMYVYDPDVFGHYKDRWVLAADSTMEYLASHPTTREDLTFLSQYSGRQTLPVSSHLASFSGGNFILGGLVLGEDKYLKFGLKLAESYFQTYNQTASGIGPEVFQWVDGALPLDSSENPPPPASQKNFYTKAGFWSAQGSYILRPETVESLYYAYFATGDKKYLDMAWQAFEHIYSICKAGNAFSSINDVTKDDGGGYSDNMQSFWLAETLKYLYLMMDTGSPVNFGPEKPIKFVFNTEAHPLRVRRRS